MAGRVARDEHLGAGFARRGAVGVRDRHEHGRFAVREQLLQIAEPGFHQHAPFGTTRHDARRGLAGAAATRTDGSGAGRLQGRCRAVAAD